MALTKTLEFTISSNSNYFEPGDRWGVTSQSVTILDSKSSFQGYSLNWGHFNNQNTLVQFFNQPYVGYTTNFGASNKLETLQGIVSEPYAGYTTNWGSHDSDIGTSIKEVDPNSIVDHPKDQIIYYKLKGYNESTQQYESWVISHNITGRPSLDGGMFDPGREPPNRERNVFKTPPSGNNLVNIVIVARWIE